MVARETDPRDARVSYAALTDAGRRVLDDIRGSCEAIGTTVLGPLMDDSDHETLADLLGRLGATGLPA